MQKFSIGLAVSLSLLLGATGCVQDREAIQAALDRADALLTQIEAELANARELLGNVPEPEPQSAGPELAFTLAEDDQHVGLRRGFEDFGSVPYIGARGGVAIRYATLYDGSGARPSDLANYLSVTSGGIIKRYTSAPTLRIIGPSTARERGLVAEAVEAINLSLPVQYRIQIGAPMPGLSLRDTVNSLGRYFVSGRELPNTIHVEFLECAAYVKCERAAATAWSIENSDYESEHGYIQVSRGSTPYPHDNRARALLAHEILHTVGIDGHTTASNSIMAPHYPTTGGDATLWRIDRDALQVIYRQMEPGDDPADFGPWSNSVVHLVGDGTHANFGVALRNGYAEPWAHGPRPHTDLADNTELRDGVVATWDGALVGFTPETEAVTGNAGITVNLRKLTGTASFTELENWAPSEQPGEAGTGTMWGDGDLGYFIAVAGNTFRETDHPDHEDGTITGIFTGAAHEGAAGTVERQDLTAAFGASR